MSRFLCTIAFVTLAGTASAQTMPVMDPSAASGVALFTPPLAGVTLPRDKRYGYDRQEHRYFLRQDKPGRGGKLGRTGVSSIYRHF